MDSNKKLYIILRAMCVFWLISRLRAYKVWLPEYRLYPSIPVFDSLDGYPLLIQTIVYATSLAALIAIIINPQRKFQQILLLTAVIISGILDVVTWQPWEYQYLCMLAVIIINRQNPRIIFGVLIIILASIYFYSGLQKFNGAFLHSVWKGLILKKFLLINDINLVTHYSGLLLAIFEAALGLGLIFSKTKKICAYLLIAMHLFILVLLGSVQGFNVVLPWNVFMIIILHYIFIQEPVYYNPAHTKNFNLIFVVLWGIMPAFSFFGLWEQKLSSNLFSGRFENLTICISENVPPNLRPYIVPDSSSLCNSNTRISISSWTTSEMRILPPTSRWYYRRVATKISKKYNLSTNCFYINTYPFKSLSELNP